MAQVYVSLTYLMTFYPEDLNLDKNASAKELAEQANKEVDKIINQIATATDLIVDDIEIEVCRD